MPRKRTGRIAVEHVGANAYSIRFTMVDGRWSKRARVEARTKADAAAEARRLCTLAWAHGLTRAPEPSPLATPEPEGEPVDVYFYRWLADRQARGLDCRADDGRFRRWVFPVLGSKPIQAVKPDDLRALVERLDDQVRAGELSWKTARHAWAMTSKMFADAKASKRAAFRLREDNPAAGLPPPDAGGDKSKAWLYPSELLAVVACAEVPLRWRRLFALAVYTYTRPGELAALEWSDLDFEHGTIHVHRALAKNGDQKGTKTDTPRRIPMEPALVPLLEAMRAEAGGVGRVVKMPPECDLSKRLRDYLRRAGVTRAELYANDATRKQITFYDLRASGLTWLALRGEEPLRIMQRAGHKEFTTTMGYVRTAETLGRVDEPFPALPSLAAAEPEGPAFWATLARRSSNPIQSAPSARNYASPAGFEPA